jgi:Na+/H+ antiporter NhaD/arsenite permease-like protein
MSPATLWAAVLIFAGTYAVIAFARVPRLHLDRPGAAVCGAVLMVVCGALSFDDAWSAIDSRTIVLLLGMMILNVLLEESGFFELAVRAVLSRTRSAMQLLVGLAILSAVLSALFLNDTVCLMLTVPVLAVLRRTGLPAVPYLIALAMSANIGSVMTVIGNPQNMLIASYSGWSYAGFFVWMAPVGLLSLAALVALLYWFYGHQLPRTPLLLRETAPSIDDEPASVDRPLLIKSLVVLAAVMVGFVVVGDLPLVAMAGASVLLLISGRAAAVVLARVNWTLLAFFAGLFIVVRGLEETGLVADLVEAVQPMYGSSLATQTPVFTAVTVVASNVVSNVPFVVLARGIVPTLADPPLMWLVLAMASTLAGNLTIPGSVATLIVLETAKQHAPAQARVSFVEFLRIGVPVTVTTTVLGALILTFEHWLFARI